MASESSLKLSLVIATYNRSGPLQRLLGWLGEQTLPRDDWEVIVAIDGSSDDTETVLAAANVPFNLSWFTQQNAGPAAARHNAITRARGERIVIIDDDMEPVANFLTSHLEYAAGNPAKTIVIGRINVAPNWKTKPLHDVVGEYQRTKLHDQYARGAKSLGSDGFATGNVSFPRQLYLDIGGFDLSFRIDEDRELGVRFHDVGATLLFGGHASAIHHSDVGALAGWLRRWRAYGATGLRVWEKHGKRASLHPLRHYVSGSPVNRLLARVILPRDYLADPIVGLLATFGRIFQKFGSIRLATAAYRAILSLEYHRGARDALGGWTRFKNAAREFACGPPTS
jgi:glycosyltransferase involved in cell wall biosynthesis